MPIVDKLPEKLREDLSKFEDDVDSMFDVASLRSSLDQRKRDMEIELKRVIPESFFVIIMVYCKKTYEIWCILSCRFKSSRTNLNKFTRSYTMKSRLCHLDEHYFLMHRSIDARNITLRF